MDLSYGHCGMDKVTALVCFGVFISEGLVKGSCKDGEDLRFMCDRRWEIDMKGKER